MTQDVFKLAGVEFNSRLIIGTGKYRSYDEMKAARNKMMHHRDSLYVKADANGDGQLDQAEYTKLLELRKERQAKMEAATPDFATLDTNKDGKISKEEMRAGMKAMHEKMMAAE